MPQSGRADIPLVYITGTNQSTTKEKAGEG